MMYNRNEILYDFFCFQVGTSTWLNHFESLLPEREREKYASILEDVSKLHKEMPGHFKMEKLKQRLS